MLSKVALVPKAEHNIVTSENVKLNVKNCKTATEKRRFQDYRTYPWFAEIYYNSDKWVELIYVLDS